MYDNGFIINLDVSRLSFSNANQIMIPLILPIFNYKLGPISNTS